MNQHAQELFCTLLNLFKSSDLKNSFKEFMALFLKGDGRPHPHHASGKSPAALSRFLNRYNWNARSLMRQTRQQVLRSLFAHQQKQRGRRPLVRVMLDLTTLEKTGRFEQLGLVHILNKKRGMHVVVMYLMLGPVRVPWSFRVWRGKGEASASTLALKLLRQLPKVLTLRYRVLVLADGGFGTVDFLEGVKALGLEAVVGMRCDRRLEDGRQLQEVRSGERVIPEGLSFPVTAACYYLKRDGKREKRMVVATFRASGRVISRWGRRRWRIEAFFKTSKSRFGLARFGQQTRQGVYRFLMLSLLAFVLILGPAKDGKRGNFLKVYGPTGKTLP